MTSEEVAQLVGAEINGEWGRSNAHGVDLSRCLVRPHKVPFSGPVDEGQQVDLWIVLEEDPENLSGYKIVFDEDSGMYGLAMTEAGTNRRIMLGPYGGFLEALDAM